MSKLINALKIIPFFGFPLLYIYLTTKNIQFFGYTLFHLQWDRILGHSLFASETWPGYDFPMVLGAVFLARFLSIFENYKNFSSQGWVIIDLILSFFVFIGYIIFIFVSYKEVDITILLVFAIGSFHDVVTSFGTVAVARRDVSIG